MEKIHIIQITLSFFSIILFIVSFKIIKYFLRAFAERHNLKEQRVIYINKLNSIILPILLIIFLSIIWSFNFQSLMILGSSFFAIAGVALFAAWSNLSNLTSSVIIFFSLPFKIDDHIRILDGDNTVEGKIIDMTLFYVLIENEENKIISYPNNTFIQKAVVGVD